MLDQFSRNLFRDSRAMFASDAQALRIASDSIDLGDDRSAAFDERGFLYMPLMHSERLADQQRSVELFRAWRDELDGKRRARAEDSLEYAEMHRAIIERFGRFPHRNALLGRESSAEEVEFLKGPGSSF